MSSAEWYDKAEQIDNLLRQIDVLAVI
jgi:hypothetical protein